jgi:methionine-rich copper-binding protein CopC
MRRSVSNPLRVVTLILCLAGGVATADAHAHLQRASPAVDGVVSASPDEVRMWFTQACEPQFSRAELRSSADAVVATGKVDPADPKQMVIPVHGLAPGQYKVFWKATSVDTHHSEGTFGFEIRP